MWVKIQAEVQTSEINNYTFVDVNGLSSLGCARQRPWRFEAVYTGFKGTDRYLLSVSHTPFEHKLGVNRTPPQELNGNKSTTKQKVTDTTENHGASYRRQNRPQT